MELASDEKLLAEARSGDSEALETLLLRHQDQVYRFGMKLCRHPEDAEDVLQDTLIAMAKSVRDFQGRSSLSTWLYTVARSFCIKKRRKSKFAPDELKTLDAARSLADPNKTPDEVVADKEVELALEAAIRALDPEHREVLVLRDVEGLSSKEVAEVLDLSVAAVKSRLHRARVKVRGGVAPLLGIGDKSAPPTDDACPNILTTFSKNLEGEINPEICAQMEQHVAKCGRCRGACASLKRTLVLCKNTAAAETPEPVQESVRDALKKFLADAA